MPPAPPDGPYMPEMHTDQVLSHLLRRLDKVADDTAATRTKVDAIEEHLAKMNSTVAKHSAWIAAREKQWLPLDAKMVRWTVVIIATTVLAIASGGAETVLRYMLPMLH